MCNTLLQIRDFDFCHLLLLASSLKIGDSIRHEDTSCGYSQFTLVLKEHKMFEACSNIKIERSVVMFPPQELPHGLATSACSTAGTRGLSSDLGLLFYLSKKILPKKYFPKVEELLA